MSDTSPAASTPDEPGEIKKESLVDSYKRTLEPWLEPLTKAAAIWLVITYVAGYLIVSVYESSFGFTELNPFKPKILAAGVLFMSLSVLGVLGASVAFREWTNSIVPWSRQVAVLGISALLYFYATLVLAAFFLASLSPDSNFLAAFLSGSHWLLPPVILAVAIASVISPRLFGETRYIGLINTTVGIGSNLAVFILLYLEWTFTKGSAGFAIHMWLFVLGTSVVTEFKAGFATHMWLYLSGASVVTEFEDAKQVGSLRNINLNTLVLFTLIPLLVFARKVYPRITASFGGGEKIPIVLFFTKDSLIKPNESLNVELIEEAENGFYFLPKGSSKAVFVPRTFVAMVSFSETAPNIK